MTACNDIRPTFTIRCGCSKYTVTGSETTTIDTAWASQKCWFMPGSEVTVTNDQTKETKIYIKE